MILNEKRLTSLMGESYKGSGYQLLLDEKRMVVMDPMWAVECEKHNIPAEVLALIVKHLGRIPEATICYKVSKSGIQTIMEPMLLENLQSFYNRMPADGDRIKDTQLSWKSATIWQREKDLGLLRMDPGLTSIVTSFAALGAVCSTDGKMIGFYGEHSAAFIMGMVAHDDDIKCMDYLGGMQWI